MNAVTARTPKSWLLNPREVDFHSWEVQPDVSVSWHSGFFDLGALPSLEHLRMEILWVSSGSGIYHVLAFCWPGLCHLTIPKCKGGWKLCLSCALEERRWAWGKLSNLYHTISRL